MSIFKAYDIRGVYPTELNEEIIYKIAKAFAVFTNAKNIVVGGDNRLSTPSLKDTFIKGLLDSGVNVTNIGTVPTSVIYFACYKLGFEAGAMVTASHNPKEFNGIKLCDLEGLAIGWEDGLDKIKVIMEKAEFRKGSGKLNTLDIFSDYAEFAAELVTKTFDGLKIVVDGSNGSAGLPYAKILRSLGADVHEIFCNPDGNFPNHKIPDPLIEENLNEIKAEVKKRNADIGFALDGDGDRLVIIDDKGEKTHANCITALLAERCLAKNKNAKIVYDVLSSQMVDEVIRQNGGIPVVWKVGHSFIPRKCKEIDALFAGEASSHYFFKESNYTDDTLIAAVKILDILVSGKNKLSELVSKYPIYHQVLEKRIPITETMKFEFIENLKEDILKKGHKISTLDGVKIKFKNGWAIFRASNTESKIVISYESPDLEEFKKIENFVNNVIEKIPSTSNTKLIIFDLEKVLLDSWHKILDYRQLNSVSKSKFYEFDTSDVRKNFHLGKITEEEFLNRFIEFVGANVAVEELKSLIRESLTLYPDVLQIVKSIRNNHRVVLASNFSKEWSKYVTEKYEFIKFFDALFFSCDVGIRKPDVQFYSKILNEFNVTPEECIFIDDKERNITGAESLGMKTILYKNAENLKNELKKIGVKIDG